MISLTLIYNSLTAQYKFINCFQCPYFCVIHNLFFKFYPYNHNSGAQHTHLRDDDAVEIIQSLLWENIEFVVGHDSIHDATPIEYTCPECDIQDTVY